MSTDKFIRIELTPEQKQKFEEAAGRAPVALEFNAEELEQRITPSTFPTESLSLSYATIQWT